MSSNLQLDPFVAQAQNDNVAPLQKIEGTYYELPIGGMGNSPPSIA